MKDRMTREDEKVDEKEKGGREGEREKGKERKD